MNIQRLQRLAAGLYVAVVLVTTIALLVVWLSWRSPPPDDVVHGRSALWAGHRWVGDPPDEHAYAQLARRLIDHGIDDVFFHVGPLDADGTIPPAKFAYAADLLDAMRRLAPGVRTQAYIGQVEQRGGGPLDLDRPEIRAAIAITASHFLDLGFGGIHYDIEPVYPGDDRFLDVLVRTRAVMAGRGVLSVALEQVEIFGGAQRLVQRAVDRYHDPTTDYLRQVAQHVDQVAIMTYDTGLPTDWLFGACLARADHPDVFVRKAIGWALREHSKVDEAAVVAFVAAHERELSGLSRREALMWRERRRGRLGG